MGDGRASVFVGQGVVMEPFAGTRSSPFFAGQRLEIGRAHV